MLSVLKVFIDAFPCASTGPQNARSKVKNDTLGFENQGGAFALISNYCLS